MYNEPQEVIVNGVEYMLVPSDHYDKRSIQRGIYNDIVMDCLKKHIKNILQHTNIKETAVVYNYELDFSFGIQLYDEEIIITTPFDGKMWAGRQQKIFRVEREDNLFEKIGFQEYIKIK